MDLIKVAEELYTYLLDAGIEFTDSGFPIVKEEMLLKEFPEQILPTGSRFAARDKSKTLLVSFSNDEKIYKRILSLDKDIPMYKEYMGFGGFDLSPRINWDLNLQKFNLALNMMANVYLALHGIKLMPNFRAGSLKTFEIFNCYPSNCWYVAGTLGCANGHVSLNKMHLSIKLRITNPEQMIFYGVLKDEYKKILDEFAVPYKVYTDFQRISRGKEVNV